MNTPTQQPQTSATVVEDFINPKSMITPSAAGSIIMAISNALHAVFPTIIFSIYALILSFILGLILLQVLKGGILIRLTYYIINSLIIFSIALGTSNIGNNITSTNKNNISIQSNTFSVPLNVAIDDKSFFNKW